MLAYVFSHRPAAGTDFATYEGFLRRFHEALAGSPPDGFVRSATFRLPRGEYSDWYLVESSAALDALNHAAVTGSRSAQHDGAARLAAEGSGKLMTLVSGAAEFGSGFEVRFGKPAGTSYAALDRLLAPSAALPGVTVWRRMMVLGPPPEFSLLAPTVITLPEEMGPSSRRIELI